MLFVSDLTVMCLTETTRVLDELPPGKTYRAIRHEFNVYIYMYVCIYAHTHTHTHTHTYIVEIYIYIKEGVFDRNTHKTRLCVDKNVQRLPGT